MDELFVKIQKLIAEKLEIDESKITLDSSFRGDLGADSLDKIIGVAHGFKFIRFVIGNTYSKIFLDGIDKFVRVKAVCT